VTSITLDGAGNQTKLVDSDNNSTSWTYNSLNLPLTETNALGTTTTGYNNAGLVTSIEDADGRVRNFTYNNDQQLTAENWMSGNTVVASMAYSYDLAGQLTAASDPNSAYAFGYNGDGNVTSTDNNGTPNVPHVVLTNTFDALGDMLTQSATIAGTADFVNNYGYDGDQQLTMAQQEQQSGGNTVANKEIDYAYNAVGQFTAIGYYDQLSGPRTDIATGAFSYDTDGRLTGLAYTANGGQTAIDTYGWGYNSGSLVTSFTSNDGTATYAYDPTNQLTSATYTTNSGGHQPANESYSFTANGNRSMSGYSTGSDNLTSSDGTYNYLYDADGNRVSRTHIAGTYSTDYKTTYTWDYGNRLTDVENYDNNGVLKQHVHYVFDVFDHLIATEVDTTGGGTYNVIDHYVFDVAPEIPAAGVPGTATAQPALIFDGNGNLIGRNLVALDPAGVDAVMVEGAVGSLSQADSDQYNLFDNLGSLRIIVDNASATIDRIVYNSAGQIAYESSPTTAHFAGFAGAHVDAYTGLVNDYHRWYDPATGKWISQDPSGFQGRDPDLSRYAFNEPLAGIDSTGLQDAEVTFVPVYQYFVVTQTTYVPYTTAVANTYWAPAHLNSQGQMVYRSVTLYEPVVRYHKYTKTWIEKRVVDWQRESPGGIMGGIGIIQSPGETPYLGPRFEIPFGPATPTDPYAGRPSHTTVPPPQPALPYPAQPQQHTSDPYGGWRPSNRVPPPSPAVPYKTPQRSQQPQRTPDPNGGWHPSSR
jgi:RHS repeat-associated protein